MSSLISEEELLNGCKERLKSFDKDIEVLADLASKYGVIDTNEYDMFLKQLRVQKTKYHKAVNKIRDKRIR